MRTQRSHEKHGTAGLNREHQSSQSGELNLQKRAGRARMIRSLMQLHATVLGANPAVNEYGTSGPPMIPPND